MTFLRKIVLADCNLLPKINQITIFQYLDENERRQLLNITDFLEYYKDEKIITQGEVSSCFFVVINGQLNVSINGENGKKIQVSSINEGDFFGETGIFTDGQRTANVSPIESAQILRIGRNDFFSFIRMYPQAGVKLMMLFVHGLMKKLNASNQELAVEREGQLDKILFFEKPNQ